MKFGKGMKVVCKDPTYFDQEIAGFVAKQVDRNIFPVLPERPFTKTNTQKEIEMTESDPFYVFVELGSSRFEAEGETQCSAIAALSAKIRAGGFVHTQVEVAILAPHCADGWQEVTGIFI